MLTSYSLAMETGRVTVTLDLEHSPDVDLPARVADRIQEALRIRARPDALSERSGFVPRRPPSRPIPRVEGSAGPEDHDPQRRVGRREPSEFVEGANVRRQE